MSIAIVVIVVVISTLCVMSKILSMRSTSCVCVYVCVVCTRMVHRYAYIARRTFEIKEEEKKMCVGYAYNIYIST